MEQARPRIEAARLDDPADLWEQFRPLLGGTPFAQAALDVAVHDLWGKQRGEPLWKLWGLSVQRVPLSDYTIGIDTIDVMLAKLAERPDFPVYKIKLGGPRTSTAGGRFAGTAARRFASMSTADGRPNRRSPVGRNWRRWASS